MRPVPHDPTQLPVRLLAYGGLGGLAVLTLINDGATRMYAMPWTALLAFTCAAPVLALALRAFSPANPLRLPSAGWLAVAAATALVPLAAAVLSPYRGASLLQAALPVAAVAFFLLLNDWIAQDPARRRPGLELALGAAAALIVAVSFGEWVRVTLRLPSAEIFSRALFERRNLFPLGHANYTAGLMLLALPWLFAATRRDSPWPRAVIGLVLGVALVNLFLSGSRGGIIGLAALGAVGLAVAGLGWKRFLFASAGVVLLAGALAVANPRIRQLLAPADPAAAPSISSVQRSAMLQAAVGMGNDRPLLGWGPGTTPLVYPRYRHSLDGGAENVLQLHSTPAQLWAETGAAGLLVAAGFLFLALRGWRQARVAAAALAGYAAFAFTDYQLDVPVFSAAVAALAALLVPAESPGAAAAGVRRILAGAVLGAAGVIAVFGARDPAPALNTEALALARNPAQRDQAVALLRQSLALNPDQEIAHFNLGWLLVMPDPAAAEKHFLAAAHLVPDKGGVYFGLGLARLGLGRTDDAARAFALECLNEPLFLASPWWSEPAIAAQRKRTIDHFYAFLARATGPASPTVATWWDFQVPRLRSLAPRLGQPSAGDEKAFQRDRLGYPVLMRNLDLPVPTDLYVVREDPRFPASVPFPLPSKGWLPSSRLLNLLDASAP